MSNTKADVHYVKEKVSVIIPVYNAEKFLKFTIESVLNQSYKNIEIIIINDCSSDSSETIIRGYMDIDSRINYVVQEKNSGVAAARNRAIMLATGQYIAFVDSDDVWERTKLQKQVELMKNNPNVPLCFNAIQIIDEDGKVIKQKRKISSKLEYRRLLHNTMIATSSVMINRYVVPEIVMPLRKSAEDYSLWLTIIKNYGPAYGIDEVLVSYRKSNSQLTANRIGELKYFYDVQVEDHKINKVYAIINTIFYAVIAAKKHFW